MEEKIQRCDICSCVLNIGGEKVKTKYGVTWTFGYSRGGWGSREDKPAFSGEVCEDCYKVFDGLSSEFNKELLFRRKGINKQNVGLI